MTRRENGRAVKRHARTATAVILATALASSCGWTPPWAAKPKEPVAVPPGPNVLGPAPSSDDPVALYEAGRFEQTAGEYLRAVESYLAAVAINPAYAEAIAALAESYYALDEYDEALTRVREAQRLRRDDPALRTLEGFCLLGLGRSGDAAGIFDAVLAARPNDPDARFGLGMIDLRAGKYSDAERRFSDALRASPGDERILLSLALLKLDSDDVRGALAFVEEALRRFGDGARAHYVAARVSLESDDPDWGPERAVTEAALALELRPSFDAARRFLASLLHERGDHEGAARLAEEAIARNRDDASAWFTLGMARAAQARLDDALYAFNAAIALRPDDETARIALENALMDGTKLEDALRIDYANAHFERAAGFRERSEYDRAFFEYRRGLRVYPYSKPGRQAYAKLLALRGRRASYYQELSFLSENGKADQWTLDELDNTGSTLEDSVAVRWKVDQFALPKRPYGIALSGAARPGASWHVAGDLVLSAYAASLLESSSKVATTTRTGGAADFAEAFRAARAEGAPYFGLFAVDETEREVSMRLDLYVGRTGAAAKSFAFSASGNDRVARTAWRLVSDLEAALPERGRVVVRKSDTVVIDLGSNDGLKLGDQLLVLRGGALRIAPEGIGLEWAKADELATVTVTALDEEIAEGTLARVGFFDKVNVRDEVVRKPLEAPVPAPKPGSKPAAPAPIAPPESFGPPESYRDIERLW